METQDGEARQNHGSESGPILPPMIPDSISPGDPTAMALVSAFQEYVASDERKQQREAESRERIIRMESDRLQKADRYSFELTRLSLLGCGVFLLLSFALIFTGRESVGLQIIQTVLTAVLAFAAGYGWAKQGENSRE